jgi:hypothetical protein
MKRLHRTLLATLLLLSLWVLGGRPATAATAGHKMRAAGHSVAKSYHKTVRNYHYKRA